MKNEQIKPMLCPVCAEFYFSKLDKVELEMGISPNSIQCRHCGWYYDLEQTNNPDLKDQTNKLSLNEFKKEYLKKIEKNPNYDYFEENMPLPVAHQCPVCNEYTFSDEDSYEICPICGWQDDGYFEGGGANDISLEESIKIFKKKRSENSNYRWEEDREHN